MPRKKKAAEAVIAENDDAIVALKHSAKRKNLPPAGLEAQGRIEEVRRIRYEYNPHLPPVLQSAKDATGTDKLPELLSLARQRALSADEAAILAGALRRHEPWLEWSGKREKPWFEVEPVALHMHERVSTQAILKVLAREDVKRDLFADPQHDYAQAVQFYKHDVDWANRMILGDSLQVMASLARREDLAGRVQMIYLDPPYGIRFGSNFQPQLGQTTVKDKEQDLTREPEMVKAYRDTWTLGIHSYLAYLRDRLQMARELLADSGSIFVQISDENLHRVRCVMDEVFGADNFCALICYQKTGGFSTDLLQRNFDYIIWYAKAKAKARFNQLFSFNDPTPYDATFFDSIEKPSGEVETVSPSNGERITKLQDGETLFARNPCNSDGYVESLSYEFRFEGKKHTPPITRHWTTVKEGMERLNNAGRLTLKGNTVRFRRHWKDYPASAIGIHWTDTGTGGFVGDQKIYVVQTDTRAVERCMLMTTDPGDLVLDPTCGSGTTAYVAETWGRRWITCDSSRVALALAKHRLMTAKFDYQQLRPLSAEDVARNPHGTWLTDPTGQVPGRVTFACKTVPHITLKSIARNTSLDPIFAKHEPTLAVALERLNREVAKVGAAAKDKLVEKLTRKHREKGANAVTDADTRRWLLPDTKPGLLKTFPAKKPLKGLTPKQAEAYRASIPNGRWKEWEVPFDTDADWPKPLQDALTAYRAAWRAKMDDVNDCISANAEMEELVDKPEAVKGVVRVTGPFTMEGVIAVEDGPDTPIADSPEELETFDGDAAVQNSEAHLDKIIRLLKASGVDFPGNKNMKFSRLDPLTDATMIHAEGEWMNGDKKERRVAVSIGPEIGNLSAMQVEETLHAAGRRSYDDIVFAGFGFDATAQAIIDADPNPRVRCHMALIRPDVAMGDLLKTQPGSQLFTVFSAPRVIGPTPAADGEFTVEVEGMDVYDPVSNTLYPTDKTRIAAWFLDSDYDGRTFCICQAFFPDKSKWAKLAKALGDTNVIDEDAFEALSGLTSLPFPRPARLKAGEPWKVAVKVVDPRGNEGLRVLAGNK
jgi:adenine-specific DNA-methyltransferase